jgi:hypothetical protein
MSIDEFYSIKPGDWINHYYGRTFKVLHREFSGFLLHTIIQLPNRHINSITFNAEEADQLSFNHELMKQDKVKKAVDTWTE